MDLKIPPWLENQLEVVRWLGKTYFRPLGIEADRLNRPVPPDHELYYRLAEMGFQARGIELGEKKGKEKKSDGPSWTSRSAILIAEEASYWDRGVAVTLPGPGLAGPAFQNIATPEQKERFLKIFLDRTRPYWGAFGMTEPGAGSDTARIRTRCVRVGNRYILKGEKAFCSNADRALWIVVWATVDPALKQEGHRAFVVEAGTPGFSIPRHEPKMGLRAYASCSLLLEDVEVPVENLLGGESYYEGTKGFKGAMKTFDATRPVIAGMALGIARSARDHTAMLMKELYDLRRPIPRYRRFVERLLRVDRKLEIGRMLCLKAGWLADLKEPNVVDASTAKAFCPEVAEEAISLCLDILADAGIRNDSYVEKLYRDVKAMNIVEGTGQIQRRIIARRILEYPHE
jgi:acyl-CoA dehydrogenase